MIIILNLLTQRTCFGSPNGFNPRELIDDGRLFKDAAEIVGNLGLNCASDPRFVPYFTREFWRVMSGVSRVVAESAQMLLFKRDYPTICHVLTQPHIDSYQEGTKASVRKTCSLKGPLGKGCLLTKKTKKESPSPSYYWPLYFIEVTEKGNDSHSKFAQANVLYSANRKIAKTLEKFVDHAGAVKLTSIVMGGANALKKVGMNVDAGDITELGKVAALTPFEKLRIRASKKSDNRSFEAAIWPVAMGELMARHFSVCGPIREMKGQRPGGYSWAFKGVPMTCPVAMSNDAYAFWDTGMIDYLDPEAVSAMAIGSNPLTCGMAEGSRALAAQGFSKGTSAGDRNQVLAELKNLSGLLSRGLNSCSFPLLGVAHGIAKQAMSVANPDKWKQTKCTLWGSVAPRMSTSVYESDYSFANTALKFKLLAHDLFSVPRGKEEKWSLAYPWESGFGIKGQIVETLHSMRAFFKASGSEMDFNGSAGRSYGLYTPGHPVLIDSTLDPKYLKDRIQNLAVEMGYLASLTTASISARNAARRALERKHGVKVPKQKTIIDSANRSLSGAERDTAHHKMEAIWREVNYCHKTDSTRVYHSGVNINVGGRTLSFQRGVSRSSCLSTGQHRGCLRVKRAKCRHANHVKSYFLKRKEIVGYRRKPHPIHKNYQIRCNDLQRHHHRSRRRWIFRKVTTTDEFIDRTDCKSVETSSRREDTRVLVKRPDGKRPETITKNKAAQEAIILGAAAAPWVAAEVTRASYAQMTGYNPIKGDRRIYTIWEKIDCTYPSTRTTIHLGGIQAMKKYDSCESAIRYEVYKYVQTKMLRKICNAFGQREGKPWK